MTKNELISSISQQVNYFLLKILHFVRFERNLDICFANEILSWTFRELFCFIWLFLDLIQWGDVYVLLIIFFLANSFWWIPLNMPNWLESDNYNVQLLLLCMTHDFFNKLSKEFYVCMCLISFHIINFFSLWLDFATIWPKRS